MTLAPGAARRFRQVDVFTSVAFKGNPLAVVSDADGLSDDDMPAMARWTKLSETTFVLTPRAAQADYRVRISSPDTAFSFAGHSTLGTAHALPEAGLVPRRACSARQGICLDCDGRIAVTRVDGLPWIGGQSVTAIDGVLRV